MSDSTNEIRGLLRPRLREKQPYGAPQVDAPVRLNTNENSYALPDVVVHEIVTAIQQAAPQLNRYPDREFSELRESLADYVTSVTGVDISPTQVWAGNGSNEVLTHVVQAFGDQRGALCFSPTYAMYQNYCDTNDVPWVDGFEGLNIDPLAPLDPQTVATQIKTRQPAIVFIPSPNNPTGTTVPLNVVEAAYEASPNTIVVVDEAYAEFRRPGTPSAIELLANRPRLVVSRTMSKAFCLAGGRLGYLVTSTDIADALRLVRLPYHLSTATQAIANAALKHTDRMLAEVDTLRQQRDRIVTGVRALGLTCPDSDSNFVLVGGLGDQQAVWRALLERGVLVRDVGIPGHLRVTAGTPDETGTFLQALGEVLEESNSPRP